MENQFEIKFIGTIDYENQPKKEVVLSTNAVTLDEVILEFEDFLKAMGFCVDHHLDFVSEEE